MPPAPATPPPTTGYHAALEGTALYDEARAGRIWLRGRDRLALLHRLSTNDILSLQPGQGLRTVLTTPIGRMIDLLTVHALDDALLLITSPDQGALVYGHLRKNIFFNDHVTLEGAGRTLSQQSLFGPQAAALITHLADPPIAALPIHHSTNHVIAGIPVTIVRRPPIGHEGFTIVMPTEHRAALDLTLLNAGAVALNDEEFDCLRVEHGYSAFGHEISTDYIPLETGLLDAISFHKGCYVGQEIIARMESRNRLAKRLRGMRLRQATTAPNHLSVEGKDAGTLTSAVISPRFGPIALAYVRSDYAAPENIVTIGDHETQGTIVALPFVTTEPP